VVSADDEIVTRSDAYIDMPGMTLTANFPGGDMAILFTAEGFSQAGAELEIRALVDGEPAGEGGVTLFSSPLEAAGGFMFVAEDVAPGSHTVKIQWHREENEGRDMRIEDRTLLAFTIGQ
jgi:hypothetical protein